MIGKPRELFICIAPGCASETAGPGHIVCGPCFRALPGPVRHRGTRPYREWVDAVRAHFHLPPEADDRWLSRRGAHVGQRTRHRFARRR
ncbi:MAG: hypothetical protein NUW22_09025 [Acidobacteria bacterium]|nr:hypothetical protein [Acidobacteriota bacterium]